MALLPDMDTTQNLIAKLRNCFDEYAGGTANPTAIREVKSILSRIRTSFQPNSYAREKIGMIEENAGIYFSARKHQSIAGGESQVMAFIHGDIDTLENELERTRAK